MGSNSTKPTPSDPPPQYKKSSGPPRGGITPEEKAKILDALSEKSKNGELTDQIQCLVEDANKLDELFATILESLAAINDTEKLRDKWKEHHEDYNNIVSESIKTTRRAICYLNDFLNHVLPAVQGVRDPKDESGRKKAVATLKDFLKKIPDERETINLKKLEGLADEHSKAFWKLKTNLTEFKGSFKKFASDKGLQLNSDIDNLNTKLAQLRGEFSQITDELWMAGAALLLTICGTGAAAWFGYTLSPLFFIGVGVGVVAGVAEIVWLKNAMKRRSDKKAEIEAVRARLDKLGLEEKTLALLLEFDHEDHGCDAVITKIDRFKLVWKGIAADAIYLKEELESFEGSNADDFEAFQRHVTQCTKLYEILRNGLDDYVRLSKS